MSDFLWLKESPVKQPEESFKGYFWKEMDYLEGKEKLVTRYHMWTLEEFDIIYDALRGHTGSYACLWKILRVRAGVMTLEEAIHVMKEELYDCLISCVIEVRNLEITSEFL